MKLWQKILCVIGSILAIVVAGFLIVLITLTVNEYKPAKNEQLEISDNVESKLEEGTSLRIMSWNIGYGGLDKNADFFMDGGTHVSTASKQDVKNNVQAIIDEVKSQDADIVFLQEVDTDSKRSYHIDEKEMISEGLKGYANTFAENYKVLYVPYPWPTIGKVDCGIMTLSNFEMSESTRVSLPCPFKYPVRLANLKRCLMVNRIPLENSDKEFVIVNLHLEAYDEGEGKIAQTELLRQVLQDEADKGNYVIAGGDFNQIFSNVDATVYPTVSDEMWTPGVVDINVFGDQWQFFMDTSAPSCRSLDQAYEGAQKDGFQYYMIDGFIVSNNITVNSMKTQDLGFENADHNPVIADITLY